MMVPLHVGSAGLEVDGMFHPQITTVKPVQTSLMAKEVRVINKATVFYLLDYVTFVRISK